MKKLVALLLALVLVVGLCACAKKAETTTPTDGSEQTSESAATAQSKGTIGIMLPTQELARCLKDQEYLTQYLNERGYDVDVQFAKGDAATQVAQMENMITNGVVGIICSPWDGSALTSAVEAAHNAGIPVIAYDALILNTPYIEYYAADDLRGIGALQAQYIVDTLKLDSSDEAHTLELFAGDYADANAPLFFEGAMNVLTPYIESGALTTGDIDLTAGYVTDPETGKKYLMGVPTDSLTGLEAYGINPEGCVMGLLASGGNLDNTLKLMQWLIDNMR